MNILLIAGHGAGDPGATAKINGNTYREADETRTVVGLLASALDKYDVNVGVYNTAQNAYANWQKGKLPASVFKGYDYALEIHFNAVKAETADGKTKGVECYVTTSETGTKVEAAICSAIARLGFTNRGVKKKNYSVISAAKKAGVSSALLEVCFIDDPDDMTVYLRDKAAVARAIATGIASGFGLKLRPRTSREIVQQEAGLSDGTMDYLASYRWGKDLLDKLAVAISKG